MTKGTKISLGLFLGALAGISIYLYRQSVLLQAICYDFVSITYGGTQNNTSTINTRLKFSNYADYPITIKRYRMDILVDGVEIGKLDEEMNEEIPARGTKEIDFIANADFNKTISTAITSLFEQLIDKSSSDIRIVGNASISTGIVSIDDYPIDYTTNTSELLQSVKNESEKCKEII
jgi:LEA14-like dessication related protein|tara:strand:- start:1486 stop:2016 length:531 start_codon:yes stop_codon:yes gene_type:complete